MKGFVVTAALGLFIGSHALPTPGGGISAQGQSQGVNLAQMLSLLQTSGLSNTDLSTLLQSLGASNSGAGQEAAGGEGVAAGEGAAKGNGTEAAAGEGEAAAGEGEGNEVELAGVFDTPTAVEGGDIKQDIKFTPSTVGAFEFEFQNDVADEVTVTENATPNGVAPEGFEFLEPASYTVALGVSKGEGLTLSKIDYIFDTTAAGLAGKDITTSKVGRLCPETGSFVISEALGEVEFEAEENEVTLNLNKAVTAEAEWGIFIPVAGAAAGEAVAGEGEAAVAEGEAAAAEGEAVAGAEGAVKEGVAAGEQAQKVAEQEAKLAEAEAKLAEGAEGQEGAVAEGEGAAVEGDAEKED
ncbi:hypothetical protein K458DRAFT_426172 [Lentithecium fluviatile CBS 122367]|uniref:Uncharacterized protein n=1 Tax=Lentithecium fluviatile CBS 122367 TaxID=1168545 RepID=A0A6G1JKH4_9PLEO|nr:hypothetical protein K458DRAFT_426172 [Lentithecium fluviatile CBS 122367]